ncbi:MAG: prepilin-type N-terminal cleavage/methylation domain-containing protein [Gammaproteobacteria bacterium]
MIQRAYYRQNAFTLIELAIVLTIVGLLLVLILKPWSLLESAQTKDLIATQKAYVVAIDEFRKRFHYYPGDLPKAEDNFATVSAACRLAVPPAGLATTGNGSIDTVGESDCVNEELNLAGLVSIPAGALVRQYKDQQITIRVIARTASNLAATAAYPVGIKHIVEYSNVPMSMAVAIDSTLDDGNLIIGNVQRSDTATPNADPVPFLGVKLD